METVTLTWMGKLKSDLNLEVSSTNHILIIYLIEPYSPPFTFSEMEHIVYELTSKGFMYHEVQFQNLI